MNWSRDLATWSLPELSRRLDVGPIHWHVQETGHGPTILLLHGAGASVHSWRHLIPRLAKRFHVVAVDLPGHGFTRSPLGRRSGLDPMAGDLSALIDAGGWQPVAILGHSAGAALGLRLASRRDIPVLVGINPALAPFGGVAGWLFPALARLLALNPFTVPLFTVGTSPARTRRLIEGTGSKLSDEGLAFYTRLMGDADHVRGTLAMMSHWSLDTLLDDLPEIDVRARFFTGSADSAVPPRIAEAAADRMADAEVVSLVGLGHLAHEEAPDRVMAAIGPALTP